MTSLCASSTSGGDGLGEPASGGAARRVNTWLGGIQDLYDILGKGHLFDADQRGIAR
jgi:hypothetical protein